MLLQAEPAMRRPAVAMMRQPSDDIKIVKRSELQQVLQNRDMLQDILTNEKRALSSIESFLKEHPPSCPGDDVPDDIFG